MDELISVSQAAYALQITPNSVVLALLDGRLAGMKIGGRWVVRAVTLPDYHCRVEAFEVSRLRKIAEREQNQAPLPEIPIGGAEG